MSKVAKILLISSMFGHFAFEALAPIYAIFVKNIGGDVLEAGAAYGIFMIVSGIFVFSLGQTRFFLNNLRPMVVLGYGLLTVGEAGYFFVDSPFKLFILQAILGAAIGILEPSWDGIYSAGLDEGRAASQWSLWAGSRNLVTGIAAFAGGAIVAVYSFTALFAVMLIFNLVALVIAFRILFDKMNK